MSVLFLSVSSFLYEAGQLATYFCTLVHIIKYISVYGARFILLHGVHCPCTTLLFCVSFEAVFCDPLIFISHVL